MSETVGVGHDEGPVPEVRGTKGGRRQTFPLRIVPESGQVAEYSSQPRLVHRFRCPVVHRPSARNANSAEPRMADVAFCRRFGLIAAGHEGGFHVFGRIGGVDVDDADEVGVIGEEVASGGAAVTGWDGVAAAEEACDVFDDGVAGTHDG